MQLPPTARLQVQSILQTTFQPLEFVSVAQVPSGFSGALFLHSLAVQSSTMNFVEGCYHAYPASNHTFPGTIVSTGTEDFLTRPSSSVQVRKEQDCMHSDFSAAATGMQLFVDSLLLVMVCLAPGVSWRAIACSVLSASLCAFTAAMHTAR